ncbi:hypothetical protein BDN67DRAFT_645284 [Paxillus ammoniavirescens]|nr:hypothetical protein BDN67DRAFT_645284 [Paxillus ammoniavirescens]
MPAQTLIPGYKQVESFGPDEDYFDEEEEVSYVTLDLGMVEPTLLPTSSTYRLIGLDTPTPFLQLSGSIFKGRHDSLLGTELLFTEEKNDTERNKRSFAHVGSTEQRIRFKEVQLKEKAPSEPSSRAPNVIVSSSAEASSMPLEPANAPAQTSLTNKLLEHSNSNSSAAPMRERKKSPRKGKERAIDVDDADAMDTT